jgi:hypothetical protein
MPIRIDDVKAHLKTLGYETMVRPDDPDSVAVGFQTKVYKDTDGDAGALLVFTVAEEGTYLEVKAPGAYSAQGCKFKGALFAALMELSFRTKFLQFEYDPADGEVRLSVDLPVMDGTVTAQQLDRMLGTIMFALENFDPVIRHAMATGRVDFSLASGPKAEAPKLPSEIEELLTKAGGLENLRRMVEAAS